jgi:anti-anti-sigma factor
MISDKRLDDSRVVIYPESKLDNNNAHDMSEAIIKAQSAGYKYIILNLAGLEFISSAGVGSIIGSVGSSREMGGDIILCGASDKIKHIFDILDLCEFLTIVPDEESARQLCPAGS